MRLDWKDMLGRNALAYFALHLCKEKSFITLSPGCYKTFSFITDAAANKLECFSLFYKASLIFAGTFERLFKSNTSLVYDPAFLVNIKVA
jgi:hypothetical protein